MSEKDKDIEDLIKIAAQEVEPEKVKPSSVREEAKKRKNKLKVEQQRIVDKLEVDDFVSDLGLKSGTHHLPPGKLYEAYRLYSDDPMPPLRFFRFLANIIHHKPSVNRKHNGYFINKTNWELQHKAYKLKEQRNAIEKKATKEETDKAGNAEVPCIGEGNESED